MDYAVDQEYWCVLYTVPRSSLPSHNRLSPASTSRERSGSAVTVSLPTHHCSNTTPPPPLKEKENRPPPFNLPISLSTPPPSPPTSTHPSILFLFTASNLLSCCSVHAFCGLTSTGNGLTGVRARMILTPTNAVHTCGSVCLRITIRKPLLQPLPNEPLNPIHKYPRQLPPATPIPFPSQQILLQPPNRSNKLPSSIRAENVYVLQGLPHHPFHLYIAGVTGLSEFRNHIAKPDDVKTAGTVEEHYTGSLSTKRSREDCQADEEV
ncbi:hypothetical protein B9Z19DRAFT_1061181 [Tuber borchii]|uniref:Uncharacterized protein n=1 Tax=Tuber borchii TaxID=42251 RepID=A0A2T7A6B2_TUBBO|nr:hypothetical protein B9Z19DRAFT_1061181 [Tuber borchii]